MNLISKKILIFSVLFNLFFSIFSQNNPDDYWLNNGFSDGDKLYVNSGNFYDDGGEGLYNTGQDWTVTFCSENGNPITLDFNGFRTHYEGTTDGDYINWDYMSINYSGSPSLVAYDTDTPQFSFTSPDGCIMIGFHSKSEGVSQPDSGWVAEISTDPPPPNNDQCSATELIVGNVCSPSFYSNKGSWDTRGLGSPSCHAKFFGGDVWFSAIVPDSGQLKVETIPGSLTYGIMVLYRGACESLTEYECVDIPGTMPARTFTGLTPGEKVYIRIFGDQAQSGSFGICATDPTAEISGFTGPGGVGDAISNKLWLKADTGVADVNMTPLTDGGNAALWMDQSGNDNHLKQYNASLQPLYYVTGMNNRPTLAFNSMYMTDTLGIFASPVNIFTVQSFAISKDHSVLAMGNATESNTLSIGREDITNNYYTYSNGKHYGQQLPSGPHILYSRYLVEAPFHTYQLNDNPQTVNFTEGQVATNGALYLGSNKDLTTFMDGSISEVVFYSKVLNEAQEIIVSNYLGAKYNVAITNDYFEYQDTHPFDLAGIGRTNAANIHTKAQSSGIISIGGASELGDNEFVLFAHDGTDILNWTLNEGPSSDVEVLRLQREWKTDITGDGPGTVSIGIDTSALPALPDGYNAYNILIDSDGDFTSGAEFYGFVPAGTELLANNVKLEDGAYIAVASVKAKINFSSQASAGIESLERPVIRVELSYAISDPVNVAYSVTSGTADEEDYSLNDDILVFEPGERVKEIVPLIFEDTIVEIPNEYFNINLDVTGSTVIAGDTMDHVYTIIDNDMSLFVSASDTIIGACDNSTTMLAANASGQPPLSYSWTPLTGLIDPSGETTIANPSETTTYKVIVSDSLGNTLEDSLEIIVEPVPSQPLININGETEFCEGGSVELSAPDGYAYSWNSGETTQAIIADTTGQYSVVVIDDNGCESIASDPVDVTEYELPEKPVISINGETELCEGESVELIAPEGYTAYEWSTGETTRSISVTETGNYYLSVENENGCASVNSESVSVNFSTLPPKPEISYTGDPDLCQDESIELRAPEGYDYLWSNGETGGSITVDEESRYSVVIINGACTSDPADSIMVNVHPLPEKPVITPSGPVNLVRGESVTLTSSEADSYLWSTSATSREIDVSEEGQYTVKVFNSQGCESELSDPVEVTVTEFLPAPEIIVEGDTSFCEGGSVKLISEEAYAYRWSNGQTTREITLTESGTYSVVIENSNGVESYPSEAVKVEVFSLPSADANITDVSCFNGSDGTISLTITNGELPYTVEWTGGGGIGGTSIDDLEAGTYDATITDANGCQITISPDVDQPSEIIVGGDVENARCPDASDGEIRLSVSGGTSPYIYNWDDGMTGSVLTNVPAGVYNVTVVDAHNCMKDGSFAVENKEEYCFRVPDIITPNGDGKNDSWEISGLELYPQVIVQIYDRWGKRVFYSEGYDNNFDGTYNGEELPMESYHYVINLNDGSPVIIGNITIIR